MMLLGKNVPTWAVVGGSGILVVGGVLYLKRKNSGTAQASGTGSGTDPATGLPYAQDNQIDPATGLTYLQEAQQYGSVSAAEQAVSAGYGGTYGGGYGGASGLGYGTPASGYDYYAGGSQPATAYTTNAQWAQAVEAGLTAIGYDAQAIGSAIGKYLLSMPLTSDQVTIVQTAVAEYGPPPVGTYAIIAQPAPAPAPTPAPAAQKSYVTPGHLSLRQIAAKLGTTPEIIIADTTSGHGNVNQGRFWKYVSNWNEPIPAGFTLYYS